MEEEFPIEKEDNTRNISNTSQNMNNYMSQMKNSMTAKGDLNLERESVDRALQFINNNKQVFEQFGYSQFVEKSIVQPKVSVNNVSNYNNNNNNNNNIKNDRATNFIPKSQMQNKEINSSIAKKKVNFSALKDKIQKECQSAITDITSNRINQAMADIQNALNLLSTYKE